MEAASRGAHDHSGWKVSSQPKVFRLPLCGPPVAKGKWGAGDSGLKNAESNHLFVCEYEKDCLTKLLRICDLRQFPLRTSIRVSGPMMEQTTCVHLTCIETQTAARAFIRPILALSVLSIMMITASVFR